MELLSVGRGVTRAPEVSVARARVCLRAGPWWGGGAGNPGPWWWWWGQQLCCVHSQDKPQDLHLLLLVVAASCGRVLCCASSSLVRACPPVPSWSACDDGTVCPETLLRFHLQFFAPLSRTSPCAGAVVASRGPTRRLRAGAAGFRRAAAVREDSARLRQEARRAAGGWRCSGLGDGPRRAQRLRPDQPQRVHVLVRRRHLPRRCVCWLHGGGGGARRASPLQSPEVQGPTTQAGDRCSCARAGVEVYGTEYAYGGEAACWGREVCAGDARAGTAVRAFPTAPVHSLVCA